MSKIKPVSDLRNYGTVLDEVHESEPVYLTKNGRGAYAIHDIKDEEYFQKSEAMIQLFCEINAGIRSGDEKGWYTEEEVRDFLRRNTRRDK
ncbi:MAG: hypothetical protein VZT48_10665 [Bulleidia sp.]|nr:hypothetical protein [Bulleidia sp.]